MKFHHPHTDKITFCDIAIVLLCTVASALITALLTLCIFGVLFNILDFIGLWDPIYTFFFQDLFYPSTEVSFPSQG